MSDDVKWTRVSLLDLISRCKFENYRFVLHDKGDGWLVQGVYTEACVDTGEPMSQHTRKWYLSPHMTVTEVVDTLFALCSRSMQHRASEHFTFDDLRVYSPHFPLRDRMNIAAGQELDKRREKVPA